MAKNTSGAVHLTSLDLDISQIQEDIKTVQAEMDSLSDVALKTGETVRNAFSGGVGEAGVSAKEKNLSFWKETSEKIKVTVSAIESLNLSYKNFLATLSGSNLGDKYLGDLPDEVKQAAAEMLMLNEEVRGGNTVTKEQAELYRELSSQLKELKGNFADAKTDNNEYKKTFESINEGITSSISQLKKFEKTAVFKNSRDEAASLRSEFQRLYDQIKSGEIDLKSAESHFSSLDKKLSSFKSTVQTGTTAFQNFVNKISESAKWQIANQLLNLLENSLSNVVGTITDTENAVVELRRVLTDAPLAGDISSELYQIAYDFGQTFESVQETAVRFAQTGMDWQEVVEATRATMLGLNTAELEVTTATDGLIAVMAQFNIEAEDLESVIDKVNITADNFPVTSEKIVAALQRAGGTASAFGLSLEETIGIITALSEATGRAGEAIGTAINSLISFSMKDTALEKFSEFLGKDVSDYGVLKLWQELSVAIKGGNTELATMMSQSEEFSDLMDETLATSIGLEEEYNNALKEQNDALKDGKDIYSTVGTYRQNYFIALLNNIGTATKAIENMDGALGYSLQENETAMSTFQKQWNQLVVSAQELAIQFGEAGFLELLKFLADAGTAVLKLTKNVGGLTTVLLALSTVIIGVKKQKLDDYFSKVGESVNNADKFIGAFRTSIKSGEGVIKSFGAACSTLQFSIGGVITVISALITVVHGVASAVDEFNEKQKELRAEAISAGEESAKAWRDIAEAYNDYTKIGSSSITERSENARELLDLLGYEEDDIRKLIVRYGSLKNAIDEVTESTYRQMKVDAERRLQAAEEAVKDISVQPYVGEYNMLTEAEQKAVDILAEAGYIAEGFRNTVVSINELNFLPKDADQAIQNLENLNLYATLLEKTLTSEELMDNALYQSIVDQIGELSTYTSTVQDARAEMELYEGSFRDSAKAVQDAKKAMEDQKRVIPSVSAEMIDLNAATYEHAGSLSALEEEYKPLPITLEQIEAELKTLGDEFNDISGKVDGFQSSYSKLIGVIEEYNQTGLMTADMVQTILGLEPEYLELLDISSDSISINEEKLKDLIKTNDVRLEQLAAIKIAQDIETLSTQLSQMATEGLTEAEIIAALTTQTLAGDLENTALKLIQGKISTDDFKEALRLFGERCGLTGEALETLVNQAGNWIGTASTALSLMDRMSSGSGLEEEIDPEDRTDWVNQNIRRYYSGGKSKSRGSSSKSTKDPFEEKLKAEKKAMDDLLDTYEHQIFLMEKSKDSATDIAAVYREMQDVVHRQADKYRDMGISNESEYIRDLQKLWWEYQEQIEEVINGIYEATVEASENAISLLENQYSKAIDRMDYSEMSQNLQKQLEYQIKIQQEAHKEAERLRKIGVDENGEAIQACIDAWWKADNAIQEINSRIEESILSTYDDFIDLADEFDLWDYMDFTKADYLKVKLEDINRLLKEGTISLKEYNALLRQWDVDMFNARKDLLENQKTTVKEEADAVVKEYEASIDALEKRKEDVQSYYDGVIEGYEAEIEIWQKRKDEVEDYYDSLIDNLNEVQEANDRINAQIDYYNARQKIITNLEQAQARSGVAWREKEMEYQQQLIDLDEDWNRTQEDWNIEDQIQQLEDLKEQATADIDATIEKVQQSIEAAEEQSKTAVDAIDQEIAGIQDTITAVEEQAELEIQAIEDQITSLSQQFANAIKQGMSDGIVDSREEFDQAVEDGKNFLLGTIDENSGVMEKNAEETADKVMFCYNHSFLSPLQTGIDEVTEHMKASIQSGAKVSAEGALKTFESSFVSPLKSSIASLMNEVQKINISYDAKAASVNGAQQSITSSKRMTSGGPLATGNRRTIDGPPATVYISNYNSTGEVAAKRTKNILQQILQ